MCQRNMFVVSFEFYFAYERILISSYHTAVEMMEININALIYYVCVMQWNLQQEHFICY